jgi:hypothetical protein
MQYKGVHTKKSAIKHLNIIPFNLELNLNMCVFFTALYDIQMPVAFTNCHRNEKISCTFFFYFLVFNDHFIRCCNNE